MTKILTKEAKGFSFGLSCNQSSFVFKIELKKKDGKELQKSGEWFFE